MKLNKIQIKFKKPTVKDWIWFGITVLFLAFLTYIVIRLIPADDTDHAQFTYYEYKQPDPTFGVPEYKLENDKYKFVLDPETTQFTVLQKDTGYVWYSNPPAGGDDPYALYKEKNNMKSTMLLTYSTENGVNNTYDSFSYSVDRDYYTIDNKGGKITVNYIVGDIERIYIIPMALLEDRMDEFLEKMKRSDSNIVKQYYRKYDIDNLNAQDNKSELLAKYPMLANDNVYVIRDGAPEYMKERIEKIFAGIGYTNSDFEKDQEIYAGGKGKNNPMFNVSIVYSLDSDGLNVSVPFEKVSFKKDYPLIRLAVLPYFGAADTTREGFMFVPEGGGAIIRFNNEKNRQNSYVADVYGWDYCRDRKAVVRETRNSYPVFGIAHEDSSFITVMDKGASYGSINADVSGRFSSYNYAYAEYSLVHFEQYDVSTKSNNAEFAYEKVLPEGEEILQKYRFVNSGSYVDMAHNYGDYLKKTYKLKTVSDKSAPVAVEIITAVDKVQQVLGFPKSLPYELTSYKNAGKIIDELDEMNFRNSFIKISGAINGGLRQKVLTSVKYISQLGGKKEFSKLAKKSEDHRLYLDGQVSYAKRNKLFDGFSMYRDSARYVSDELVRLYDYSDIWYNKDNRDLKNLYYLVKPSFAARMTDKLVATAAKNNFTGVSFSDLGEELSSDFNEDRPVSRETSKHNQSETFRKIKESGQGIMISNGNDYALPYVDCITNMDYQGTRYLILDERIPFYQMAIHGLVDYTGEPVNLAPDANGAVLDAAAYGGGLFFVFTEKSTDALQDTAYTEYYGAGFNAWKDSAESIYSRFNKELGGVFNKKMTDYENLNAFVSRTVYEDGTVVYVNRGNLEYQLSDGKILPAEDYFVRKESRGN